MYHWAYQMMVAYHLMVDDCIQLLLTRCALPISDGRGGEGGDNCQEIDRSKSGMMRRFE